MKVFRVFLSFTLFYMYHFSFGQEPSVNREKDWRLSSPKVFNEIYRTRSETIHDFDVLHYKFDLTFPMISSAFSGIVTLTCQSGIGELHEVELDMVDLVADSVLFKGKRVSFSQSEGKIVITVEMNLSVNSTFDIVISYHGSPENGGFYYNHGSAYTFAEPIDARRWFPCHDVPWDKATADLHIKVPVGMDVASIGLLKDRIIHLDGISETFHWQTDYPVATYLICVTISDRYARWSDWYVTDKGDSIELAYYILREDSADAVVDFLNMVDAMDFFSDRFGLYPFEKYGMAEVEEFIVGGMEHQTMSTINQRWINGDRSVEDGLVHELAHMWWGDAVTLDDWPAIWLNEGFATYSQILYSEYKYGVLSFQNEMERAKQDYFSQAEHEDFPVFNPPFEELFNWGIIYNKGAWILHMLRRLVGDDLFWEILKNYYQVHLYGNASIDDFQAVTESVSQLDLTWFFDQWIYREGFPQIQCSWIAISGHSMQYDVQLTIQQTSNKGMYFRLPLDVRIQNDLIQKDTTLWINNNQDVFSIRVNFQPETVLVDPDRWVLMMLENGEDGVVPGNKVPDDFRLLQNYPNPFNVSTTIYFDIPNILTNNKVRMILYDTSGKKICTLLDEYKNPGRYWLRWNGRDDRNKVVSSGLYIAMLESGRYRFQRKMIYIK